MKRLMLTVVMACAGSLFLTSCALVMPAVAWVEKALTPAQASAPAPVPEPEESLASAPASDPAAAPKKALVVPPGLAAMREREAAAAPAPAPAKTPAPAPASKSAPAPAPAKTPAPKSAAAPTPAPSVAAAKPPASAPAPSSAATKSLASVRLSILAEAEQYIDRPYVSPPSVPNNFDCSGLISYVFSKAANMKLPASSSAYLTVGEEVAFADAEPGDVLVFTSEPGGKTVNHVAILYKKSATGELRGSWLIHAISIPNTTVKGNPKSTGVKITELGKRGDDNWQLEYFLARFLTCRRVIR